MTAVADSAGPHFATCMGLYIDQPVAERHFAEVRQAGFDTVEVPANLEPYTSGTRAEIDLMKKAARQNDLKIGSIHIGFDALTGEHQRRVEDFVRRDLDLAAELGAEVLIAHAAIFADPDRMIVKDGKRYPGFTVDRDLKEWPSMMGSAHENLDRYVQYGKRVGVAMALETDWHSSHRLIEFVEPFEADFCGICFDTGHAQIDSGAVSLAKLLGPRVIATHLHDNDGQSDQHLPPFEGNINWAKFISTLKAAGYTGSLTFETMQGDMEDLKTARARLSQMWNQSDTLPNEKEICKRCET